MRRQNRCLLAVALTAFGGCAFIGGSNPPPAKVEGSVTTTTAPSQPAGTPGPDNTGVPAGTVLARTGGMKVSTDGAVVDGRDIRGTVRVEADNVTIRRSRVTVGAHYGIMIGNGAIGTLIEDVEINGQPGCAAGIGFQHYTARRVNMHGCSDGAKLGADTTVEHSWIHDLRHAAGDHNDGLQGTGGSNIIIRFNSIENPNTQTSCILLGDEDDPTSNVLVEGNHLNGGNFTLYLGAGTNRLFKDNRFGRDDVYGLMSNAGPFDQSGNVWDDDGQPVTL